MAKTRNIGKDSECREKESKVKVAEVEEGCLQDGVELCQTGGSQDGVGNEQYKGHIWGPATGDLGLLYGKQPEGDQAPTTRVPYIKA